MNRIMRGDLLAVLLAGLAFASAATAKMPLAPDAVPRFTDPLPVPNVITVDPEHPPVIGAYEIKQQILPAGFPQTPLWGYGLDAQSANYPGPTLEVNRANPITLTWANQLPNQHLLAPDTSMPVRLRAHLRASTAATTSLDSSTPWIESNSQNTLNYPHEGGPGLSWYHDDLADTGPLSRYAGLVGLYIVREPSREQTMNLPIERFEIPIVLEDKDFFSDGSLKPLDATTGVGNFILANGKVWPFKEVDQHRYRLRLLNASSRRFFRLSFDAPSGVLRPKMYLLGTDGGYLHKPLYTSSLLLGPGEIGDVVVDFVGYRTGLQFTLVNTASAPYPNGFTSELAPTRQVMQFRMVPSGGSPLHERDMDKIEKRTLAQPDPLKLHDVPVRELLVADDLPELNVQMPGSLQSDRTAFALPAANEVWEIVNLSRAARMLHVDSMRFRVLSRQELRTPRYLTALALANMSGEGLGMGHPNHVSPSAYTVGDTAVPDDAEELWRHNVRLDAGTVTRVATRWSSPATYSPSLEHLHLADRFIAQTSFLTGWHASTAPCKCAITTNEHGSRGRDADARSEGHGADGR